MLIISLPNGTCRYDLKFLLKQEGKDCVMNVKHTIIVFAYGSRAGGH